MTLINRLVQEQESITRAVQQAQQSKWTTWEDVVQRSLERCVENVPAPACFRDKVNVRLVDHQGQFAEVGSG